MKIIRTIVLVLVVVLILILLGGFIWYNDLTRGMLPQHSGELSAPGLEASVTVVRDEWGIPQIYAASMHDLFFAQGYTQAQDRWWQMEFSRHVGSGSISELTGKTDSVLRSDLFLRTVGWRRSAEAEIQTYPEEVITSLQAFSDGVNAYMNSRDLGDMALEYGVLGLTGVSIAKEPWTPVDSIVWGKALAWNLAGNRDEENERLELYQTVGPELTQAYFPDWPFGQKPTIIQPEDVAAMQAAETTAARYDTVASAGLMAGNLPLNTTFGFGQGEGIGSNDWVVSGDLTETGMPLLADDPHLGIQMPSIWYEIGLHCAPVSDSCPMDVVGFALPAAPAIIIGHNANIAWGVTNVGWDVQDQFMIKLNPDNPLQYEWNGTWRDIVVHNEVIEFGDGEEPLTIQVRETHVGPIVNDNRLGDDGLPLGFNIENPMALRWTGLDNGTLFVSVLKLNRAQNWDEFREALSFWNVPAQNFVYADIEGNIGYQTPGSVPVRAEGESGLIPTTCAADTCAWQGYVPFDMLPRVFNPERGYIATANQALVPLEYYTGLAQQMCQDVPTESLESCESRNYAFSQDWDYGYRGQRIVELLTTTGPHSIESFQRIHGDNKMIAAEELMPYLAPLSFDNPDVTGARDWLLNWDYQMHMDSPEAALYGFFWQRLMVNLYNDQLPEDWTANGGGMQMWATTVLAEQPDNLWWDDMISTPDVVETRDDILKRSFQEGYDAAVAQLGSSRDAWKWGTLHTATFASNPLGVSGIDLIENMVNRGPVAASGGPSIVNATSWSIDDFSVQALPSMRMIVDLGDLTRSVSMHTTGQSGHPFSEHYGDMIESWRMIQYHPMLFSLDQVEAAAANTLILKP